MIKLIVINIDFNLVFFDQQSFKESEQFIYIVLRVVEDRLNSRPGQTSLFIAVAMYFLAVQLESISHAKIIGIIVLFPLSIFEEWENYK